MYNMHQYIYICIWHAQLKKSDMQSDSLYVSLCVDIKTVYISVYQCSRATTSHSGAAPPQKGNILDRPKPCSFSTHITAQGRATTHGQRG